MEPRSMQDHFDKRDDSGFTFANPTGKNQYSGGRNSRERLLQRSQRALNRAATADAERRTKNWDRTRRRGMAVVDGISKKLGNWSR